MITRNVPSSVLRIRHYWQMELGLWKLRVTLLMRCDIRKQKERILWWVYGVDSIVDGRRSSARDKTIEWHGSFVEISISHKIVYEYRCKAVIRLQWDRMRSTGGDRRTVTVGSWHLPRSHPSCVWLETAANDHTILASAVRIFSFSRTRRRKRVRGRR